MSQTAPFNGSDSAQARPTVKPDDFAPSANAAAGRAPLGHAPLGLFAATWAIMRKDLLLEWRGRAHVNATIFFAVLTLLLFSFAVGPYHNVLAQNAPGYLWLSILLSSVLSLGESQRIESENAAFEGLRLLSVKPTAVFLGKALVNTLFLLILGVLLVPIAVALYNVTIAMSVASLIATLALGCAAISAPGTLYAAIAVQARARDVVLPLLLFPILVPGLLAAVKATTLIVQGDPMAQLPSWTFLLVSFNLVYWILCALMFGRVMEE
jgi:heme exporter protein B